MIKPGYNGLFSLLFNIYNFIVPGDFKQILHKTMRAADSSVVMNCSKFVLSRVLLMAYSSILLEYVLDSTYS